MNRALKIITAILLFMVFIVSCNNSKPTNNDVNSIVQNESVVNKAVNSNNHDFVDLGLPSGTLWATCNVGATQPEDYGNYYAWGEIRTKTFYTLDSYQHASGSRGLTKYCTESDYDADYGVNGFIDNLTILETCDDAATANWGTGWRMPTEDEWEELLKNTTSQWTTQNGVRGKLFTAKNGKTLFLPAAGSRVEDEPQLLGTSGFYWSGSLDISIPDYALGLWMDAYDDGSESMEEIYYYRFGDCSTSCHERFCGFSVRPVRSEK